MSVVQCPYKKANLTQESSRTELLTRLHHPPQQPIRKMDQETLGSVVLLAIVTLISVVQNAPAAFAGLMYLFVRQKYFVGYLGERTQSTPGYLFGKRIILFLFLMSVAGILNYYLIFFFGSDFEMHIKTITSAISPLLLIP
ncbi:arachidonate 5-lipoxygenase-activating protein [Grus japonensis]|uniref:Arachidonate 5-lipoxygenase-activating protein n=1 Tax=Grus japonensis TaxID=30415 RepID=A0ABC9W4M9_GRUJA